LPKSFSELRVFGDSYSTPKYCVEPAQSFWGLAATHLGIKKVFNYSWPGNSFDSIMHVLISCQLDYAWEEELFIIGIPPLERFTFFDNHKNTQYQTRIFTTDTWQESHKELPCHRGLMNLKLENIKDLSLLEDRAWSETLLLNKLFLMCQWLESKSANYLLVNLSKDLDENNIWSPTDFVLPYFKEHNRSILFRDTYYSINLNINPPADYDDYGWMRHHGSEGNQRFFEKSLLPALERGNLC